jgi:hypothetical protein
MNSWTSDQNMHVINLIGEIKRIIFILMYIVNTGKTGRISIGTLISYFDTIRKVSAFCYEQRNNDIPVTLQIKDILEHPSWMARYMETEIQPTFTEAVKSYGLKKILDKEKCYKIENLSRLIARIQFLVVCSVHMYTGMRKDEVLRLPYLCLDAEYFTSHTEEKRKVNLISTTTKFTGYRKEVRWYAPSEVIKAIEFAQPYAKDWRSLEMFVYRMHP